MRRLCGFGTCAFLLAAAGCVPPQPAFDGDPLFGGQPRLPRNTAVASQHPAANVTAPAQLPPASGGVSPAALAAAVPASDSSALRIPPAPAALSSATHDNNDPWQPTATPAGAQLQAPQPLVGPPPRPVGDLAPSTGAPVVAPSSPSPPAPPPASSGPRDADQYSQLLGELDRRGVLFQSLQGPDDQGVWSFSCGVPRRNDPQSILRVEASAVGDHGLAAIRAALSRIDQEAP
ncbi:MAG TPA: hypothetical protein VMS17_33290 [Gemmataceae bacterium]|nr:hypothetical protein [Gemmataceae bacterium]